MSEQKIGKLFRSSSDFSIEPPAYSCIIEEPVSASSRPRRTRIIAHPSSPSSAIPVCHAFRFRLCDSMSPFISLSSMIRKLDIGLSSCELEANKMHYSIKRQTWYLITQDRENGLTLPIGLCHLDNLLCGNQFALFCRFLERLDLIEVHVAINLRSHGINF